MAKKMPEKSQQRLVSGGGVHLAPELSQPSAGVTS